MNNVSESSVVVDAEMIIHPNVSRKRRILPVSFSQRLPNPDLCDKNKTTVSDSPLRRSRRISLSKNESVEEPSAFPDMPILGDLIERNPLTNFRLPPTDRYKVYVCVTPKDCSKYARELLRLSKQANNGDWSVVGFDCEWKVVFQKGAQRPIALIQISRYDVCILFHVHYCGLQPELIEILFSSNIFKVGVNISGDVRWIFY